MNFNQLIESISDTHDIFQIRAFLSVNVNLTLRNWFIGMYIVEFEQNGQDRASYGNALIKEIAIQFKNTKIKGFSFTNLNIFRKFYLTYPQIVQTASVLFESEIEKNIFPLKQDVVTRMGNLVEKIMREKIQTVSEQLISPELLINRLSFSHFVELIKCEDEVQRRFYEIESIKGTWAVRELKRQINSLLFERTGLSKNKEKLLSLTNSNSLKISPEEIIRDPYFFEFAGLKPKEILFTTYQKSIQLLGNSHRRVESVKKMIRITLNVA